MNLTGWEAAAWWTSIVLVMGLPVTLIWYVIHPFAAFWRRVGAGWAYAHVAVLVIAIDAYIWSVRDVLLAVRYEPKASLVLVGAVFFMLGTWIGMKRMRHLTASRLLGAPELSRTDRGVLLTEGMYGVIRHPRYVEVTLGWIGVALMVQTLAAYVVAVLLLPILFGIVLFEERELAQRFGDAYRAYTARVPRFVPSLQPLSSFLVLTFGLTLAIVTAMDLSGFSLVGAPSIVSQLFIVCAMFVPGVSALVVQRFVAKAPLRELGFRFGPWRAYAKTYAVIVALFAVNYALTWIFVAPPDPTLQGFLVQYGIADTPLPLPAGQMLALLALVTFVGAPLFNFLPALGEELGWRGLLLPRLMPMGRTNALVLSGLIWAVWHTPMILVLGFGFGAYTWPGAVLHFLLVTGLGAWFGHVWLETRSVILAAFMHAVFNANAYGIWAILWASSNPLLVGPASVFGACIVFVLGAWSLLRVRRVQA